MNRATDDLISRTEAKDFVRSERGAELLKHFSLNAIIVLKLLDEVPAAQEPVVHGRWETIDDCGITRCSACKWNFEGYIDYNYCPNCGAKMED